MKRFLYEAKYYMSHYAFWSIAQMAGRKCADMSAPMKNSARIPGVKSPHTGQKAQIKQNEATTPVTVAVGIMRGQ